MNDKQCFVPLLSEHASLFGEGMLDRAATDKGYWSRKNHQALLKIGVPTEGLQKPPSLKQQGEDKKLSETLRNRRAGIEPLIGHVKHGQLGRSRMKSDAAKLAAG